MPRKTRKEKRDAKYVELCWQFDLALEQASNAQNHGRDSLARGCLRHAKAFLRQIRQHIREDTEHRLFQERNEVVTRLQDALAEGRTEEGRQLAAELSSLDSQLEAV